MFARPHAALFSAVFTTALVAAVPLLGVPAASADECSYGAPSATTTGVSATAVVEQGEGNNATVTVASENGTPDGDVTLSIDGGASDSQPIGDDGSASFEVPTDDPGIHTLAAGYGGSDCYLPSAGTGRYVVTGGEVAGEEASSSTGTSSGGSGGAGSSGGTASGNNRVGTGSVIGTQADARHSLGATGADTSTELLGILGLALVGAGTASIVVNRRRLRADG